MGRWSQARRRGGSAEQITFTLPPPVVEEDWDAFDGVPEDGGGNFQFTVVGPPPPGADALFARYRLAGSEDPWTVAGPYSDVSQEVLTPIDSDFVNVQAAWTNGGLQVSDWSVYVATVQTAGL